MGALALSHVGENLSRELCTIITGNDFRALFTNGNIEQKFQSSERCALSTLNACVKAMGLLSPTNEFFTSRECFRTFEEKFLQTTVVPEILESER